VKELCYSLEDSGNDTSLVIGYVTKNSSYIVLNMVMAQEITPTLMMVHTKHG
jgi:hypothetical protein